MLIDGDDAGAIEPHELRRRIGYVFQHVGLFPHLTVGENVGDHADAARLGRARIAARVDELLELRRARSRHSSATGGLTSSRAASSSAWASRARSPRRPG